MTRLSLRSLGPILAASCFIFGCARAYHAYPNGCVGYGYRPQPAPPFSFYRGCPTPWLVRHEARLEAEPTETQMPLSSPAR